MTATPKSPGGIASEGGTLGGVRRAAVRLSIPEPTMSFNFDKLVAKLKPTHQEVSR